MNYFTLTSLSSVLKGQRPYWISAALTALWLAAALPAVAQDKMEIVPININEANAEVLAELPGIGPNKAQTIIDERDTNGAFTSLEDLTRVSGIGEVTVERLQGEVSF